METFKVKLSVEEDFCESDLIEAITNGIENIGNHNLKDIIVKEF